jgi:Domain of unknown function (DUF5103)
MKFKLIIILLFFCSVNSSAQTQKDTIYAAHIRTVLLFNSKVEQSFPMIQLNSSDVIQLKFDDFHDEYTNYAYTIEHCDADWNLSSISSMEYIRGFNRNFISEYKFSSNTNQNYVHYQLQFPNNDVEFLISGNYILKVFPANDDAHPLFSARFMIYENKVQINHSLRRSTVVNDRNKKQKLDLQILAPDYKIDNPFDQLKVVVMQNNNWKTAKWNRRPSFFEPDRLTYDHVDANDFDGLNEFRRFDIRSFRFLGERLARILQDTAWDIYVVDDYPKNPLRYVEEFDNNGNYFVKRSDMGQSDYQADYGYVHLSFRYGAQNPYGDYYVLGRFNNWQADEKSRMKYSFSNGNYESTLYLKQGIYDYMIGFKSHKSNYIDYGNTEGNFYDTQNDYRVLVYYRRTGFRYDELIAVKDFQVNP